MRGALVILSICIAVPVTTSAQGFRVELGNGSVIERLPDGNFRVTYRAVDEIKTVTFVPATKIVPQIRTRVTYDRRTATASYEYVVANGVTAEQELHSLSLRVMYPTHVGGTPAGWKSIETPSRSRLSWYQVPRGPFLSGIPPGRQQPGFSLLSQYLPVPTEVRTKGATGLLEIPPDLPEDVFERLDQMLFQRNHVEVWAITPGIPAGSNEPEITASVFVARILAGYYRALDRSSHPNKTTITNWLTEAIDLFETNRSAAMSALLRARQLAVVSGLDPWASDLSDGLVVAIDHVISRY